MANKLNAADLPIRLEFCQKMLQMVEEDGNMLNCLFMSNEDHFNLNGNINKQNCRIWSASNPQILHQTELHPLRITVWCAISSRCIVEPYFFEEKRSHRYGYWRPLVEHAERVFLSRITPNENSFQLCVVSWCNSSHSPACYDRISTKISQ